MQTVEQIARLKRIMRRLAAGICVAVALSLPLGYFAVSYSHQAEVLHNQAGITAERVAQYAYVQGMAWAYTHERLGEFLGDIRSPEGELHVAVHDSRGRLLSNPVRLPDWPRQGERAPVIVSGRQVGEISVTASIKPILLNTVIAGILGLLLGGAAFIVMHLLPLRALEETLEALQQSLRRTQTHAAETDFAYEQLKRQHRLVEETTHELMDARDQAMAADRTKSAFLATMSHELRTPLNAVIGFSEMMGQEVLGPLGDPRYLEYCESIRDSGRHLLAVINDVLDLSKVEAGKLQLHLEDVDLWQMMEECRRLVRIKGMEAGVELSLERPAAALPTLRADAVKLKQVVLNLLSNAMKFTPRGGRVAMSLGPLPGERVFLRIADTGIGMTEAEVGLAVQPFQQVDNSHTRKYEGTGLGLPLAKALAEHHGGSLEIASAPGQGTVVTVILPARAAGGAQAAQTGGEPAERRLNAS